MVNGFEMECKGPNSILIVVPTEREAAFFASHGLCAHICGVGMAGRNADGELTGSLSKTGNSEVRVEICGVGMAECAATTACLLAESMLVGSLPDLVVLAGIAGTYDCRLAIGETVVVASETVADLGRREYNGRFVPLFQKSYFATVVPQDFPTVHSNTVNCAGGLVVRTTAAMGNMEGTGGDGRGDFTEIPPGADINKASVENMEGAAFFGECERFSVRAMEIRTISNRVGERVTSENLDLAARRLAADLKTILTSCV